VTDGGAGVIEVGCVVAAVGVHVGDVGFEFDVWIEVADVSDEGMESFASGEVEMQEIVDGGAQVARAAI